MTTTKTASKQRAAPKAKTAANQVQPAPVPVPPLVNKSRTMRVSAKPGESADRAVAGIVARGVLTNASTIIRFEKHEHEGLSLIEMTNELEAQGAAVNRGDLASLEQTLTAQALSLNAIFGELARIAQLNIYSLPDVAERYLRVALKAQSQSRATVETLAAIKNPPVVFARQANINNGGQQQVNNGAAPSQPNQATRTEQPASVPNELLEDSTHGGSQMDSGATTAAGRTNPGLEPVGALNRAAKC